MVVLIDGGSASASEILAGALHDNGVAQLVGTQSFGKGSVQELVPITPTTSLKVTIAKWLTPNGISISHQGLTPDVVVPLDTAAFAKDGTDTQLNKAVSILDAQ
jgi:carboxyl-terminal processing protease